MNTSTRTQATRHTSAQTYNSQTHKDTQTHNTHKPRTTRVQHSQMSHSTCMWCGPRPVYEFTVNVNMPWYKKGIEQEWQVHGTNTHKRVFVLRMTRMRMPPQANARASVQTQDTRRTRAEEGGTPNPRDARPYSFPRKGLRAAAPITRLYLVRARKGMGQM